MTTTSNDFISRFVRSPWTLAGFVLQGLAVLLGGWMIGTGTLWFDWMIPVARLMDPTADAAYAQTLAARCSAGLVFVLLILGLLCYAAASWRSGGRSKPRPE